MTDESLIFEGLKVLDVGSWIAGPVAATMLADRGAEVIKMAIDNMPCYLLHQPLMLITLGRWMRETNDLCRLI
jgi:hypothetical protein